MANTVDLKLSSLHFFFSKWLTKKWLHDPKEEEEEEEEESSLSFFFCAFGATIFFPFFFFFMACNFKSHKALLKLSTASHGHRERRWGHKDQRPGVENKRQLKKKHPI